MMKLKSFSSLQKTYDQAYLTCSTAVYYESLTNTTEALRSWQECLSQLNAASIPSSYRPKTQTEHALLKSLQSLREQCEDRIGLLKAIIESRKEAGGVDYGPPLLSPAILPERPPTAGATLRSQAAPTLRPTMANQAIQRSPSPDKKTGFLSTLRPPKKSRESGSFDSLRKSGGPKAAAQAATLAWSSISRREGEAMRESLAVPGMDTVTRRPEMGGRSNTVELPVRERRPSFFAAPPGEQKREEQKHEEQRREEQQERLPGVRQRPQMGRVKTRPRSSLFPMGSPTHDAFDDSPPPPPPPHKVPVARPGFTPPQRKPVPRRDFYPTDQDYDHESDDIPPPLPPKLPPRLDRLKKLQDNRPGKMRVRSVSDSGTRAEDRRPENVSPTSPSTDTSRRDSPLDSPTGEQEDDTRPSTATSEDREWADRVAKAIKSIGRGVDPTAVEQVANEIVVKGDEVHWDDVAGLEGAKLALKEAVVYPFLRPDLFSGLREPAKGMLLFGPPGTGKTMLARAVATESKSTFFSISASSLTSKYLGESEKLVRALFALAKALAPSIIFVDEIDSLLSARGGGEHEATRRIKTEFLIQWSDLARAAAGKEPSHGDPGRVLVLAATNLPWAIDEAARRRFSRRQYIPLPEAETRKKQLGNLLGHQRHALGEEEMERLVELTGGFSGSDITALAKDAAMGPLRSLGERLLEIGVEDVRGIGMADFEKSLERIRPSVGEEGLKRFEEWAEKFGERV